MNPAKREEILVESIEFLPLFIKKGVNQNEKNAPKINHITETCMHHLSFMI